MTLQDMLSERKLTVYQCSKYYKIPYTTLLDLVKGKTRIEKCSAETLYKLSRALRISMEEIFELVSAKEVSYRDSFEVYKSNVCHRVKDSGDMDFIIEALEDDLVTRYWRLTWYAESFYMLGILDYLCRVNEIPICRKYEELRTKSLEKPLFPPDIEMAAKLNPRLDKRNDSDSNAQKNRARLNSARIPPGPVLSRPRRLIMPQPMPPQQQTRHQKQAGQHRQSRIQR